MTKGHNFIEKAVQEQKKVSVPSRILPDKVGKHEFNAGFTSMNKNLISRPKTARKTLKVLQKV